MDWPSYAGGILGGLAIGVGVFTILHKHAERQRRMERSRRQQLAYDKMIAAGMLYPPPPSPAPPLRPARVTLRIIQGGKTEG